MTIIISLGVLYFGTIHRKGILDIKILLLKDYLYCRVTASLLKVLTQPIQLTFIRATSDCTNRMLGFFVKGIENNDA